MGGESEGDREKGEFSHTGSSQVSDSGQGKGECLCRSEMFRLLPVALYD